MNGAGARISMKPLRARGSHHASFQFQRWQTENYLNPQRRAADALLKEIQ